MFLIRLLLFSLTVFDPNMLRRSGTYDSVPVLRMRPESLVSDMSAVESARIEELDLSIEAV